MTSTPGRAALPRAGKPELPPAAVMGDLNLVRCLGMIGASVTIATPTIPNPARLSRYCDRLIPIPDGQDQPEAVAESLMSIPWEEDDRPSLFYQGDHDLLVISRYRELLAERYRFVLPPASLVEDLVDKARFLKLALRLGLDIPRTRIIRPGHDMDRQIETWRFFPCIVKPALRTHWFESPLSCTVRGPQKAIRLEDRRALDALRPELESHHTELILQECVEGGEERIVSFHAYIRPNGECAAAFTGRKIRTHPRSFGMSCCVEVTNDARVHRLGRYIADRLSFHGVLKMDFKEDLRDGRLHLLEINPRFNLWHYPAAVAGVNIPALVYRDLNGLDWQLPIRTRPGMRWLALHKDIQAFTTYRRHGELTLGTWLRSLCARSVYDAFAWDDPAPALLACWIQLGKLARAALRRNTR